MNPPLHRAMVTGAVLAGLIVPVLCSLAAWVLAGSAVRVMFAITVAALLNMPSPLGGGMVIQGVLRVRWMKWEWTFDADRSLFEGVAGYFLLSAVTTGGFFVAAPVVGAILRGVGPLRTGLDEVLALGAVALLVVVAAVLHRSEIPLRSLRSQLERQGAQIRPEELASAMRRLSWLARPEGGIGHVGGIGARTVGLHEHLEAEALLRFASKRGASGAAELHARCLDYLLSRAEPGGGFSVYPSGLARAQYTAQALEALKERLDESSLHRHRAALLACQREDGRFGRSAMAPASEEATTWARGILGP
ncbi:MAG: hypothetical protein ACJ8AT_30695 [Hyalangium sp.]|uniref:hypothetical protein n=1 Tax=Hyalangium sp. TaxID=2028555 RepID=UPI003899D2DD